MATTLILVNPITNIATDVGAWGLLFEQLEEEYQATGRASAITITLRAVGKGGANLPVVPVPGMYVVFGDDAFAPGNPDPWLYYFVGKAVTVEIDTTRPDGPVWSLTCADFLHELNLPTPGISFTEDAQPTDSDRVSALFAALAPPGPWDAVSRVGGPFISYAPDSETPYAGKIADILTQIAGDPGGDPAVSTTLGAAVSPGAATVTPGSMVGIRVGRVLTVDTGGSAETISVSATTPTTFTATYAGTHTSAAGVTASASTPVAARRWFTSAAWTDPDNYALGLTRYVEYVSNDGLPPDPVPLTDAADGYADWAFDSFNRGNDSLSLNIADSGHVWAALAGQWGTNSSRAYLPTGGSNNVTIVETQLADPICEVTLQTVQDGAGLAFRISSDTGGHVWKGWMFIGVGSNSRYELYKRSGGTNSLIGTVGVTPANGDLIRVTCSGASITAAVLRSSSIVGSVATSDAFQQSATWHGLAASAWHFSARWDAWRARGAGARYIDLTDTEDGTGLGNILQIAGPPQDPVAVVWDTLGQPPQNAATLAGSVIKTAGTDAWDAGATVRALIDAQGGALAWTTDARQIANDTFTRADDPAFIGALESGQDWARYNAAFHWGVINGTAYAPTLGATGMGIVGVNAGAANCIVEATMPVRVNSAWRLVGRASDQDNCLFVTPGTAHYELYKRVAGVLTLLATGSATPANGDSVKLDMEDSTINVYINGVFDCVATSTFNQSVTFHGFGTTSAGATARWDNFSARQSYATRTVGLRRAYSYSSRQTPDFGILFGLDRSAQVTEGGSLIGSPRTYSVGDAWRIAATLHATSSGIRYDIEYSYRAVNTASWVLWHTSATHPDLRAQPHHADVALYSGGASIGNLTFQPPAADLFMDLVSIGIFGVWPAGDLVQDNSLDTYQKRSDHAVSFFAEHAGLRKTYACKTLRRYRGGTSVLFNSNRLGITNARKSVVTAKTNRETHHRTDWLYELTLDAPARMSGVRDRRRYLRAGPDGVVTPQAPTGLAAGVGIPDGGNTRSVVPLTWDPPGVNAREIEFYALPVSYFLDPVRASAPASARSAEIRLAFLAPYHLYARYLPFAGAAGPWCAPVDAIGGPPGLPPAPTVTLTRVASPMPGRDRLQVTIDPLPNVTLYQMWYSAAGVKSDPITTSLYVVFTGVINLQSGATVYVRASADGGHSWGPTTTAIWNPTPVSFDGVVAWTVTTDAQSMTDAQGVDAARFLRYKVAWQAGPDPVYLTDADGTRLTDGDGAFLVDVAGVMPTWAYLTDGDGARLTDGDGAFLVDADVTGALEFAWYDADGAALVPTQVPLVPTFIAPDWGQIEDQVMVPTDAKTVITRAATLTVLAGAALFVSLYTAPAQPIATTDLLLAALNYQDTTSGAIVSQASVDPTTGTVTHTNVKSTTDTTFEVHALDAIAIHGLSVTGAGVRGESTDGNGLEGVSATNNGLAGVSTDQAGAYGTSVNGPGVLGQSVTGPSGRFQSANASNTDGTVRVVQIGSSHANLMEFYASDDTTLLAYIDYLGVFHGTVVP